MLTDAEVSGFIQEAIRKGWSVRAVTHPKSKANWNKNIRRK